MKIHLVSFLLIFSILLGWLIPAGVQAKKLTPDSGPGTRTGLEPPLFEAEQLLAPPDPPIGCSSDTYPLGSSGGLPIPDQGVITATMPVAAMDNARIMSAPSAPHAADFRRALVESFAGL